MSRARKVLIAFAAALTVLTVVFIVGMNTNRVYVGAEYRNVEALPATMPCGLSTGRVHMHYIDAANKRWYATWAEGYNDMPRNGIVKGTLRVTELSRGPSNAIWGHGSSSGDRAVLDTENGTYLFRGGWPDSCD